MIDTVSSHWGFFVGKQTSLPWGLSWEFLESYLIWVEINTKNYLFIFLRFQAVFRNLANVHTQGTIKGLLLFVVWREFLLFIWFCSQVPFLILVLCYWLWEGIVREPWWFLIFATLYWTTLFILMARAKASAWEFRWALFHLAGVVTAVHEDSGTICVFPQCPECWCTWWALASRRGRWLQL